MENNDEGRRAGSGSHSEIFYGTHESENNMVMSEKVNKFLCCRKFYLCVIKQFLYANMVMLT